MGRPRKNPELIDENNNRYVEVIIRMHGHTGEALVPASWVGHRVRVTLLD